jgi:UDP-2,3-diacylglucosamine pyrophosphatase LpxH
MRAHNMLVISDLHLGEDLGGSTGGRTRDDSDLVAFLQHYANHDLDGLPWRLIINGDMVDFVAVCVMPDQAGHVVGLHPDDHHYGLGTREVAATIKLERVIAHHDAVFRALARFVGKGNELAMVIGNHDADFHWPAAQALLQSALAALWSEDVASAEAGALTPEGVAAAVSFHPWFFLEEGVAWIEHGHQYDPYCSFEDILAPSTDEVELDANVGSAVMRYVANHHKADVASFWGSGFWGYLGWAVGQGVWRLLAIGGSYRDMVLRLLGDYAAKRPERVSKRRARQRIRMERLARVARVPVDLLQRLHALRRAPVGSDFDGLVRAIMLDQLLVLLALPLLLLALTLAAPLWLAALIGSVLVAASVWFALRAREPSDPRPTMRSVASSIRKLAAVPIVVFGHSHDPEIDRDELGGRYFNTGTWVRHEGGYSTSTHVMIRRTGGAVRAQLCQWRYGASRAFDPSWS